MPHTHSLDRDFTVVGRRAPPGSAYYDPVGVATQCILAGQPLPVDLQADLEAMGWMIGEFTDFIIEKHQGEEPLGFQLS